MGRIGSILTNVAQWSQAGCKGWVKYRETWYYLDEKDGDMKSDQFVKYGNGWYYLKPDGTMADKPEFTVEPDGLITTK